MGWVSVLFYSAESRCPYLQPRHMLFRFDPLELSVNSKVFVVILVLLKLTIWLARNDFHFHDKRPCVANCLASLKANLLFCLGCHFRCLSSENKFFKDWCANGHIACIRHGDLYFKLWPTPIKIMLKPNRVHNIHNLGINWLRVNSNPSIGTDKWKWNVEKMNNKKIKNKNLKKQQQKNKKS